MREIRLSATAIQDWLECTLRFLYRYVYGLRPMEEKESQRIGEVWHGCHEIVRMVPQSRCPKCLKHGSVREDCYLCGGTGVLPKDMMDAVTRYVNCQYTEVPEGVTAEQWEVERTIVLYSFSGYRWYFTDSQFDTVVSEAWFDIPIINPETNREMLNAHIVGKVDHILRHKKTGLLYVGERKSTSKGLDDASYWGRLEMDPQITTYLYALRVAQLRGDLEKYGIARDEPLIQGVHYDVWHKPDIAPKTLSQADTRMFMETAIYCGQKFKIAQDVETGGELFEVNGTRALVEPGKRGFAIRETPEMYGARLLTDIAGRPSHYFEQREIARTDDQLAAYERDLCRIVKAIRAYEREDLWVANCRSCESPFWCDYRQLCHNHVSVGPNDTPNGFVKGK